jgi:dinuclear metal center YbgI/SA1388 family protein
MTTLESVAAFLERLAPPALAESWDNVGLLVGDRTWHVQRIMTCLTITPASAAEAIEHKADVVVTHHPLPFHPLRQVTAQSPTGRLLLDLITAGIAVYSAHTAFDSAPEGINHCWAKGLNLRGVAPLVRDATGRASGRWGWLVEPISLRELAGRVKDFLSASYVQLVGRADHPVRSIGVACGAGGEFLEAAHRHGCDVLITGEARFHTCLEADALGMGMILTGHYASERFALDYLAGALAQRFHDLNVWASRQEHDPIQWIHN